MQYTLADLITEFYAGFSSMLKFLCVSPEGVARVFSEIGRKKLKLHLLPELRE